MSTYIYIVAFLAFFGVVLFYKREPLDKNKKIYIVVSFFILFLFMGFRDVSVGTDTKLYVSVFQNYSTMSWLDILTFKDPFIGFAIFNKLVSLVSTNPHSILIASSGLICYLTGIFIYKNSNHVVYSTLLFVLFYHYLNSFNIFRQYIAIMIVINALPLLIKRQTFKYILVCLLAISIHNTAIMSLFLFPLSIIKFNKQSISIYTLIMCLTIFLVPVAMEKFAMLFPHYGMYFENQYMNYSGYGLTILIVIYIAISLLAFFSKSKVGNDGEKDKFMLLLMINNLAIITNIMSYRYFILYRVSLYYSIFLIIFIPMVFDKYKKNSLLYFLFLLIMLVLFVSKLVSNDGQVVPYKTDIVVNYN